MRFCLTILGSNSAKPAYGRHPTAQILTIDNHNILIDCGEGTQMQMLKYGVKFANLNHIFISHLHGDHCLGFFGLLGTFANGGRTEPLNVFGPVGLREMFETVLKHTSPGEPPPYPINWHTIENTATSYTLLDNDWVRVSTIPLVHGLPTTGFLFEEKAQPLNIRPEAIAEYNLHYTQLNDLKKGADLVQADGTFVKNELLTLPAKPLRKYAYCSDTTYQPTTIVPLIKNVDLLYHEATFLQIFQEFAVKYGHSTAHEAAQIATAANAKQLLIGHFSSRYDDLTPLFEEAKAVFSNTHLAIEGQTFEIERVL